MINLVAGEPLTFANGSKGIKLEGFMPVVVSLDEITADECWIHDPSDRIKASILARFFDYSVEKGKLPRPFGVFYQADRPTYEEVLVGQIEEHLHKPANLNALLAGENSWEIG